MNKIIKLVILVENDHLDGLSSAEIRIVDMLFSDISSRYISAREIKQQVRSAIRRIKKYTTLTLTVHSGVELEPYPAVVKSYRFIDGSNPKFSPLIDNRYPNFQPASPRLVNTIIEELVFVANSLHLQNKPELATLPSVPKEIYISI
jgi:hypothetical protein